jgi:hypothetical protein
MQTVLETHVYKRHAEAVGLLEDERHAITMLIAANPDIGDLIPGTGGARKVRVAGKGKGKSGGYRVVTYYAAPDVPVFLLDIYAKGEKINLTKAEKNELRTTLATVADDYRESVKEKVKVLKAGSRE